MRLCFGANAVATRNAIRAAAADSNRNGGNPCDAPQSTLQRQGGGVIWEDVPLVVGGSCVGVLPFYEVFSPAFAGSSRNVVTLIRCELGRLQLLLCSYDALLDAVEMRPCSWKLEKWVEMRRDPFLGSLLDVALGGVGRLRTITGAAANTITGSSRYPRPNNTQHRSPHKMYLYCRSIMFVCWDMIEYQSCLSQPSGLKL